MIWDDWRDGVLGVCLAAGLLFAIAWSCVWLNAPVEVIYEP